MEAVMDRGTSWSQLATLAVALLTLAAVTAVLLRPLPAPEPSGPAAVQALEREVGDLRAEISELVTAVRESQGAGEPVDLSSLETRLDGLEASMRGVTETIQTIAGTASTICQLVADSPFTPGNTC
jgi:hypothetical protein